MYRGLVFTALLVATPALAAPGDKVEPRSAAEKPETDKPIPQQDTSALTVREAIKNERRALQSERAELEQLKVDLQAAEAAVDQKIQELQKVVDQKKKILEETKALKEEVLDKRMARLVQLTEKMPPAEAAAYLSKLDEPTASKILQGMRVRQASKVMAALNPKKAASLSRTYLRDESKRRRSRGKSSR